jgi:dTDP-4-amino-4,6-dideoxygalactose transaminase
MEDTVIGISKLVVGKAEEEAVLRVLRSGQLAIGPETSALEAEFSSRLGGADCIAVTNGTVAITLALAAIGVGPGDEVITTAYSFLATIEPIIQLGAIPVFADVELRTANIDISKVEALITARTKAILPVHLYGRPVDLRSLRKIASERDISIVEDACQAIGSSLDGVGAIGSSGTTVFSFYGSKNITCGEGGLVATDDPFTGERVRLLRNHGMIETYRHKVVGYNGRLTDIQAALLRVQLGHLDEITEKRQENAAYYQEAITNEAIILPPANDEEYRSCFHQFTIRLTSETARDHLQAWASDHGIETRVYYPYTLSSHSVVESLGLAAACPNAEELAKVVLSIPVRDSLGSEEKLQVAEVLNSWIPPE